MKNKILFIGVLSFTILFGAVILKSENQKKLVYKSRIISGTNASIIEGAFEHYYKMRGDFSKEDWMRIKQSVELLSADRTVFNWYDQGPDNIGGRTRAILVDNNNINHVYAGAVSGGLFESFNQANTWNKVPEFEDNLSISSICQTEDGTFYVATGHQQEQTSGSQNAYDTGANGGGVFKVIHNTDGTHTVTLISGTETLVYINEVVADTLHNLVWISTNQGLKTYDPIIGLSASISNGLPAGACNSLSISTDGTVIVAGMTSGRTFVSQNSGALFTNYSSSSNTANPIAQGSSRIEYAISYEKSGGNYIIYASAANSNLTGIWKSADNGINWQQIAPGTDGQPGSFDPFDVGGGGQGTYDNVITAVRGNPEKLIMGGIDAYSWSTNGNWEQISQWFLSPTQPLYLHADQHEMVWDKAGKLYVGNDGGIAVSEDGGNTFYPANRGYNVTQFYAVGFSSHGDVIGGTQDNGTLVNYHDNSTWQSHDVVGGGDGFSADISFINRNFVFGSIYYSYVFRSYNRGQNTSPFMPAEFAMAGTNALGCSPGSAAGDGCGQFFTNFTMWENPSDLNSTDTVEYIPQASYDAGEIVDVPSKTTLAIIKYTTPADIVFDDTVYFNSSLTVYDTLITTILPSSSYNLALVDYTFIFGSHPISAGDSIYISNLDTIVVVSSYTLLNHYWGTNPERPGKVVDMGYDVEVYNIGWDTLRVQDPYQSWFAIGLGGANGIWMTRNALRFSAPNDEWFRVADITGEVSSMEFSRDGDHLFIGTWSGEIYRLSGFGDVYSPAKHDNLVNGIYADSLIDITAAGGPYETSLTLIGAFGAPVTGIAVESDLDHVVVTLGYFTGTDKVRESNNASGGSPTWTSISGNLPSLTTVSMPLYSVVIDRDDPNIIVVGGEFGTFFTENGGVLWENCSGDFGNVPVFDMGQNWRTWDEGCHRPGEIYIGTHGRGIWKSDAYLGVTDQPDNLDPFKYISTLTVYPNPLTTTGNVLFDLGSSSDVYVKIFNLQGQLVEQFYKENMLIGKNNLEFDTSELPRGTYIIHLTANGESETTKFIKN